jgi:FAD-dependent urate hydroxylase
MNRSAKLRVLVVGAGVGGIATARALLRDGHEVTVFEQRPQITAGGGAVTIWSHGAAVLSQLGVDMDGAGQRLDTVRVETAGGRRLVTLDLGLVEDRLGAPIRMVPRRTLLERLLSDIPVDLIRCASRVRGVTHASDAVLLDFDDGSRAEGDVLVGADGLHSTIRRVVGAQPARSTGWCSWQGLVRVPHVAEPGTALMMIGERGNLGLWPAGGSALQWWFDLPWSADFVRPASPIELIRSHFAGWSDAVDQVLATLTDADLTRSPFPHFRHPIPGAGRGAVTLLGDAAHTMPPTLAQGTNQALLDTMVLRKALSPFCNESDRRQDDLARALRWYELTRRRKVKAVSWVTTQQVSRPEAVLRPAAIIPDRVMTAALTGFLRWASHHRLSADAPQALTVPANSGPFPSKRMQVS